MSEDKKEVEKLVKKINEDTQNIEFAFGATLDEKDEFENALNSVRESLDKLTNLVNDKYDDIKNDEELKAKMIETKDKALIVLNQAKVKITDYYNSDEVQHVVNNVSEFVNNKYQEVKKVMTDEDSFNQAKLTVLKTTIDVCDKLEKLIRKDKQR